MTNNERIVRLPNGVVFVMAESRGSGNRTLGEALMRLLSRGETVTMQADLERHPWRQKRSTAA